MAHRLIIGLDFGTTQISVAFAFVLQDGREPVIEKIMAWQGRDTYYVPCHIAYAKNSRSNKTVKSIVHGWDVQELKKVHREEHRIRTCFKGGLYRCDENLQLMGRSNWPSLDSSEERTELLQPVEDMLRWLREYILTSEDSHLRQAYATELDDPKLKVEWILGVPPVWGELEQQNFVNCATRAGMLRARRVTEPEAMAHTFFKHKPRIQQGEVFVLIDAGGGTVDAIGYEVTRVNPLGIQERAISKGRCCGSMFLNLGFEKYVRKRLAKHNQLGLLDLDIQEAVEDFDSWKKGFKEGKNLYVELNPNGLNRLMEISSTDLRKHVFDPVFDQTIRLTKDQIQLTLRELKADQEQEQRMNPEVRSFVPKITAIILGGGMSNNKYLMQRMQESFRPIEVQNLPTALENVTEGLVLVGLSQGLKPQRQAQASYGILSQYSFKGSEEMMETMGGHEGQNPGEFWVPVIEWPIVKGQAISTIEPYLRDRYEELSKESDWRTKHEIVVCHADVEPDNGVTYWANLEEDENGKHYMKEPGDCEMFEAWTDLLVIRDRKLFQPCVAEDGTSYARVDFRMKMRIQRDKVTCTFTYARNACSTTIDVPLHAAQKHPSPALGSLGLRGRRVPFHHHEAEEEDSMRATKRPRTADSTGGPLKKKRVERAES